MKRLKLNSVIIIMSLSYLFLACEVQEVKLLRKLVKEDWSIYSTGVDGSIDDIFFVDDRNGWAAGWQTLLYTDDAGVHWQELNAPGSGYLSNASLFFTDASNGWLYSFDGLFKTTNGGRNWSNLLSGILLNNITFLDAERSWAVTFDRQMFVTNDGWESWNEYSFPWRGGVSKIQFLNENDGWLVLEYENFILYTSDGGINWVEKVPDLPELSTQAEFLDVFFIDENTGWLLGYNYGRDEGSFILKTIDGGESWDYQNQGMINFSPENKISFINERLGWVIASEDGRSILLKTTDGGENWIKEYLLNDYFLRSLFVTEDRSIWVGDGGGFLHNKRF